MAIRPQQRPVSAAMLRFIVWLGIALVMAPMAPALAQTLAQGPAAEASFWASLQQQLVNALAWIDGLGAIAPLAFILLYIVITVAFVPASVVTLGAGVVFGVVKGSALVFVGAMLGATAAFLVGRYGARGWVASKIANNPKFQLIDNAIARDGRKLIFLLRLSPVFPFNLLNYSLGLSQISLKDYVIGSVGMLPGTIMYVYLGSLVGNLATLGADSSQPPEAVTVQWIIRIVGLIATVAVTLYITRLARTALNEALPQDEGVASDQP
ncbi:TVP38/TMEM64 family protein [Nodosilinea sp. E11]|uniref:TVP38/TMEM64 family protein n=1 Tax=Nodosilinea sp. E11 TaxID=3037479 RepID=UPI0029341130|nr:TVP38/TMEM64 family protein [Nodosilinea sp. E11]WOD37454.1 TVP38/TMEM64 family protein [Nodosilinea sp. E11]